MAPKLDDYFPATGPHRKIALDSGGSRESEVKVKGDGLRCLFLIGAAAALLVYPPLVLHAQDLAPRAYLITPIHSNAVTLSWSFYDGSIDFNGVLPVSDAKGKYSVPIFSYYHSFGLFGRSANIVAALPYGVGNFQGLRRGRDNTCTAPVLSIRLSLFGES